MRSEQIYSLDYVSLSALMTVIFLRRTSSDSPSSYDIVTFIYLHFN